MASLFTSGNPSLNPILFNGYDYQIGFCNSITSPTNLVEFKASEESLLRTPANFVVAFDRIVRITASPDTSGLQRTFTPTFTGVIIIDKNSGDELALLVLEPFTEPLTINTTLDVRFNLSMEDVPT